MKNTDISSFVLDESNTFRLYPSDYDLKKEWFIYYYLNKKRIKEYRGFAGLKTVKERLVYAQRRVKVLRDELAVKVVEVDKTTLQGALMDALDKRKNNLEVGTYRGYKGKVTTFAAWCTVGLVQVNRQKAVDFIAYLQGKKYAVKYINEFITVLKMLFNDLIEENKVLKNPFQKIKKLKGESEGAYYFNEAAMNTLLKSISEKSPYLLRMVQLLYYCFLRPRKEARQLKIGDIDLVNKRIKVRGAISKNKKTQFVVIPEPLYLEMIDWGLGEFPNSFYLFGKRTGKPNRTSIGHSTFSRWHLEVLQKEGFNTEMYEMYSWKHTGAVMAVLSGIGLKELQLQLRHHSLDQVDKYLRRLGVMDMKRLQQSFPSMNNQQGRREAENAFQRLESFLGFADKSKLVQVLQDARKLYEGAENADSEGAFYLKVLIESLEA